MRILRAPARPTLLQQGSKLEPEEAAKGMKTESARWITKRKGVLCKFCVHLSGSHFCNKDLSWGTKGQPKERKWEMPDGYENINDFYVKFARTCQDRTFAARIQIGTPRDSQRNVNGKRLMGKKHKRLLCEFCSHLSGDFFAARIQIGTPRDSQRNENGIWLMGKKNINEFYANFARTCQDRTFAAKIQIGNPRDTKRNENGNSLMGEKNINDFYVDFARTCQDHILAARSQVGTSRDSQRNENGKCLMSNET